MNEKLKNVPIRRSDDQTMSANSGRGNRDPRQMKITFENIEKMHYSEFNNKGDDDFRPNDIIDDDDSIGEDEILRKFKKDIPSPKKVKKEAK